jgi:hypothetical protein
MTATPISALQQRITSRVRELLPRSVVKWQRDPEAPTDWIAIVLNLQRSEFQLAKAAIREFRDEAELLGIDLLPMVKDVQTSLTHYSADLQSLIALNWPTDLQGSFGGQIWLESSLAYSGVFDLNESLAGDLNSLQIPPIIPNQDAASDVSETPERNYAGFKAGMERCVWQVLAGVGQQSTKEGLDAWISCTAQLLSSPSRFQHGAGVNAELVDDQSITRDLSSGSLAENEDLALAA